MYKLVLLRHGESVWNKENIFTGWVDVELSDLGKEQAKQAGILLKESGFVFDVAFTSVLKRATQTLDIVLKEMGLSDVVIVERSVYLNERHYGLLQGMNKKQAVEKFGLEQVTTWRRGYKERPPAFASPNPAVTENEPTSESLEEVCLRVVPYWQEKIAPLIIQGRNILISAHGNSLRALIKKLDDISDKDIEKLNIPVGIPLVYELDEILKPIKHYYLGDEKKTKEATKEIADQLK
ncbi:MAG: 2,3-bisphosphoglycerate-dependent phosphoglycerate mutase [Candidatus Pacebacteria bacterium]|nr:2,3-bisphosphoglycerate-dependent phosphoglycerate mutase [Candidatus Paceibacterota bacterium]